ncbi:hypothetical protein AB9F36_34005, partial [Rhizobium leguminosarum]|uniref:hypothetical protein n=1 Tax=Rhizobium leguminosarum TaxID=384 RepID=UPI003F9BB5FD
LLETVRVYSLEKLGGGTDYRMTMMRTTAFFHSLFQPFSSEDSLQLAIDGQGNSIQMPANTRDNRDPVPDRRKVGLQRPR